MENQTTQTPHTTPHPHKPRHYLAVFFLSFMWGTFGVDRMYLGKVGTGILKLITFGGFGLWVIIDLVIIMTGAMRDKQGQPMLQYAEYKKFSQRVVLWFAIILGSAILVIGLTTIAGLYYVVSGFLDGTLTNQIQSIPGVENIAPTDIDSLNL